MASSTDVLVLYTKCLLCRKSEVFFVALFYVQMKETDDLLNALFLEQIIFWTFQSPKKNMVNFWFNPIYFLPGLVWVLSFSAPVEVQLHLLLLTLPLAELMVASPYTNHQAGREKSSQKPLLQLQLNSLGGIDWYSTLGWNWSLISDLADFHPCRFSLCP